MAEVTAQAVKALRELTDLPMMKCKQALQEAEGDQEKAVEILKREAGKVMLKRAENVTQEGRLFIQINEDATQAAMVELQCESAPVAANEDFLEVGEQLAKQLLQGPSAETAEDLLDQPAPDRDGQTLRELYEQTVNKIREKIVPARIARVDGPVGGYVHHDGKIGVLFQATGEPENPEILRDMAMHIAALKPTVVKAEDLPSETVEAERQRLTEEARQTGKPENIIEKIVEGRLKNFYVEQGVLLVQPFAKDDTKTVSQVLAENGLQARNFLRWTVGEEAAE